jgi:predicted RND superfamily exporter protein
MSIITFCAAGSAKSPRRVLLIAVVIMAVSLVFALRLQVSTDISALMPAHSRISGTLLEVMSLFGTTDRLILVIESADGAESEDASNRRLLRELADQVGRGMEQSGLFDAVDYRITPEQRAFYEQLYFGHPFHFHAADALEGLRARLAADYIEKQVAELAKSLRYSPMGAAAQRQLLLDPLGFRSGQQASLGQGNVAGFRVDLSDGYFFSRDGRSVFIIARPAFRSQDIVADARLMEEMENILAGAGGEGVLQADYSMALGDGFGARLLGPYVETLYGSQAAQEELLPTILLTCLGLLLLFAVVFRSIRLFMVLLVPVVAGILVTAGLTAVFSGHLTMITVGFAAMLAGLGIDFGIHLADRVGEESAGAGDMRTWILTACTTTGKGVVAGGLTSAVIFMLIGTSEFAALRQFGWIVGVGIVLTLIATFTLLPALLVKIPVPIRRPRKALLAAWAQWMVSHHRLVGLAGIAITGALGYAALQLSIENNIYELGPMNQGYERQKDRILSESGGTTNVVMAVVTREELEDSLRVSEQVADVLEELQARGAIESYAQVASVLPSDHSQQASTAFWPTRRTAAHRSASKTCATHRPQTTLTGSWPKGSAAGRPSSTCTLRWANGRTGYPGKWFRRSRAWARTWLSPGSCPASTRYRTM